MKIAEKIKSIRIENNYTQKELADILFVSSQAISNWENGKNYPDIPALIKISDLFDVSLDILLKDDKEYVKQVEKDYEIINRRNNRNVYNNITIILMILILVLAVSVVGLRNTMYERYIGITILILCLGLIYSSYKVALKYYNDNGITSAQLLVPKIYGIGLAINPNHKYGKLIYLGLGVFFVGLLIYSILFGLK